MEYKQDQEIQQQRVSPKSSSFAGDILKLVSGSAIAQALSVLIAPVLTRLYAPESFGTYTVFTAIIGIFVIISCLSYEHSIVLPKEDEEAANQLGVTLVSATLTSLLSVPLIWIFGEKFLILINAPQLAPYRWFIPVIVFFGGIGAGHPGFNYWNYRTRQIARLSIAHVFGVIVTSLGQLFFGIFGMVTAGGLIGGASLGAIFPTIWLARKTWQDNRNLFVSSIRLDKMLAGVQRYSKFPRYSIWGNLLNAVSWQLPAFLLSGYFSQGVVGYYALGYRVLSIPMNMIGGAIARSFLPRAAEAYRTNALPALAEALFKRLIAFTFFPLLTLSMVGPDVFLVVFGKFWTEAGVYTQILGPFSFVWFISVPLGNLFNVLEKQEFVFRLNIIIFLTRALSLIIGGELHNPHLALILFSVSGVFVYGYLSLSVMRLAGVSVKKVFLILWGHFLQLLPVPVILILMKVLHASALLIIAVAGLSVICYLLLTIKQDPEIQKYLMGLNIVQRITQRVTRSRTTLN